MTHPALSLDALIAVVHDHYPAGVSQHADEYQSTPEYRRFSARWDAVLRGEALPAWEPFCAALDAALPDCSRWDYTVPRGTASRCMRVSRREAQRRGRGAQEVVAAVSILAPVYTIFEIDTREDVVGRYNEVLRLDPSPDLAAWERILAEQVERIFAFQRVPPALCTTPVPDRVPHGHLRMGQATLLDLLFITPVTPD